MYLVISKCVTADKVSKFPGHYLHNRSTLDIGVLGYIGIVQHKKHSPEVLSIPPETPCIYIYIYLKQLNVKYDQNTSCGAKRDMYGVKLFLLFLVEEMSSHVTSYIQTGVLISLKNGTLVHKHVTDTSLIFDCN